MKREHSHDIEIKERLYFMKEFAENAAKEISKDQLH